MRLSYVIYISFCISHTFNLLAMLVMKLFLDLIYIGIYIRFQQANTTYIAADAEVRLAAGKCNLLPEATGAFLR
jgi:hypothetical protein